MDRIIEQKHRWKQSYLLYGLGGVALMALLIWGFAGSGSNVQRVSAEQLTISSVTQGEFNDYVRLNGTVVPIQVVQISPEEGGIVQERVVEEGQRVKRGEVILRLANSSLDLQILNAEAELAEKQNLLRNTQVAMQQDRLNNETESATLAMDVRRKQRAYQQNERLYQEKLIARETYEQSREDYELAQRKQALVTERLRQDSLYRSVQMEQMEDNLDNMRRNVLLIRDRKGKLEVRSTIDGELGLLDVELGQSISAGQKIGQINDLSDFKIEAQIDEHYIDRVTPGLAATFERQNVTFNASLRKVYPEVRDGKFKADFKFEGEVPENIRSGQTYYLNLQLGQPENAVLVPRGTFYQKTGGKWIFVVAPEGGKAVRREIRIGRQNPQYYEVLEGLQPGEKVITSGYDSFGDNDVLVF